MIATLEEREGGEKEKGKFKLIILIISVQPAVIVGAFVGIYTDDYYATDM